MSNDKMREALASLKFLWSMATEALDDNTAVDSAYEEIKAALTQQPESEPKAVLCREIGETTWFDHNPLPPDDPRVYVRQQSPQWETCTVYPGPQPTPQVPDKWRVSLVNSAMIAAGMDEWTQKMNAGERHWPNMLEAVFVAMANAAPSLEKPNE